MEQKNFNCYIVEVEMDSSQKTLAVFAGIKERLSQLFKQKNLKIS